MLMIGSLKDKMVKTKVVGLLKSGTKVGSLKSGMMVGSLKSWMVVGSSKIEVVRRKVMVRLQIT